MTERSEPFKTSPTNPDIAEIQTIPERHKELPYAPAIRIASPGDLLFLSGCTPATLYHSHPHIFSEHDHPNSIVDQTRLAMNSVISILEHEGLSLTDVVKVTKYLTDMRDLEDMGKTLGEYFGDWKPASTAVCVNQLSTPGARIELDVTAVFPKE